MKKNRILTAALAGALSLSLAAPALGLQWEIEGNNSINLSGVVEPEEDQVTKEERDQNGHTTFVVEILEDQLVPTVKFEVPLYVVLGAVDGDTDLMVPSNYEIKNISDNSQKIGVTKLEFARLNTNGGMAVIAPSAANFGDGTINQNKFFGSVTNASQPKDEWVPSHTTHMTLSIGGLWMPNTNSDAAGRITPHEVLVNNEGDPDLGAGDNAFYAGGRYIPIEAEGKKEIQLLGRVSATPNGARDAFDNNASQFRVKFFVSPLDVNDQPIEAADAGEVNSRVTYVGNSREGAGLNAFVPSTPAG